MLQDENVWLNSNAIANLFNVDRSVITKHINNIYNEEELVEDSTCAKIAQVQKEGNRRVKRNVSYYNNEKKFYLGLGILKLLYTRNIVPYKIVCYVILSYTQRYIKIN